ncbi:manganese efflux pump MntP family protein [Roseospira marina]|uniref:Putative manganese efflux pump MntP n=1 Tax=Roseospira marina TaxID=140057 RepID=A0A5M6I9T4_9PROT|nr:manganese efflux pump MntP family protein [Roseospira marina]KAA5605001.1 manganese efflux pump MntP family protein [Roseospira marina]MBB4314992.1 putative Mn2+ efflux pump MntP [Roseospira marina]MBB5087992.1 putative Mn2+ efflux pump MntP [Roseospira marina]
MSPLAIGILALGMSIDALVAAIGRGACGSRPGFLAALRTGLVFGLVEAVSPLIGWAIGIGASAYVARVDHWIAFVLLGIVGGRMVASGLRRADTDCGDADQPSRAPLHAGLLMLVVTAVGTSIDSMAVGVSLAFLNVNILLIAVAIGCSTTVMATTGMLTGRLLGTRFGRKAEILGGVVLIGLGSHILASHILE